MKTWMAKPEEVPSKWWLVDGDGKTVGRLASEIAKIIRGKNKPEFTPHVDTGDFVIVTNCEKVKFSGTKLEDKRYYRHTGYFGGIKDLTAKQLHEKDATQIISNAVEGMLPKNRLGRKLIKKLKPYNGTEHPHGAQNPEAITFN